MVDKKSRSNTATLKEYDKKYGLDEIVMMVFYNNEDKFVKAMQDVLDGKREPIKAGEIGPDTNNTELDF